jgi:hypothetical protein
MAQKVPAGTLPEFNGRRLLTREIISAVSYRTA